MPFTGTVLDHLTKPRPDTRFCTGVLRQTYPAARPPVLPSPPGVVPATSSAPAVMAHTTAASVPAAAAVAAAASSTTSERKSAAAGAVGVSGNDLALSSGANGTASGSNIAAAHHSTAAQGSEAAAPQDEPAFAPQKPTSGASPNAASQQAGADQTRTKQSAHDQHQGRATSPVVKDEPETATADVPPATAHPVANQEMAGANVGTEQGQAGDTSGSQPAHQAATTSSSIVAASIASAAAAVRQQQQAQQQPQQLSPATVAPVEAPTAGQGPVASSSTAAADPWNALDVVWDSDTPPAWPKLVCPWQVRMLRRTYLMQLTPSFVHIHAFHMQYSLIHSVIHALLKHCLY